jgi:hypothetical protein
MPPTDESRPMPPPDELSLGDDARERLQSLLAAIRNAEHDYELMLYIERFFSIQTEVRHYFSLIEREVVDKLHHFRDAVDFDLPPTRALRRPTQLRRRGAEPHGP